MRKQDFALEVQELLKLYAAQPQVTALDTLLKNDTIVEPSKPKFTAPLFGKERPQMAIDTISAASSPKINETR